MAVPSANMPRLMTKGAPRIVISCTNLPAKAGSHPASRFALRRTSPEFPRAPEPPNPRHLETVFHRQLNYPPVVRAGDASEVGRADLVPGLAEAGLIEQVERLDPELEPVRSRHHEVLEQGQIGARESRPSNAVARRRSGLGGVGKRAANEAAGREPLVDGVRRVAVRAADLIRPVRQIADAQRWIEDRGRKPGLRLDDAVQLPASCEMLDHGAHALRRRQLGAETDDEAVTGIEEG